MKSSGNIVSALRVLLQTPSTPPCKEYFCLPYVKFLLCYLLVRAYVPVSATKMRSLAGVLRSQIPFWIIGQPKV